MDQTPEQQDIRRLLEETLVVAKENQRMLRAMRRDAWFGFIGRIIWWVIIIVLPLYLYSVYLAPVVSKVQSFMPGPAATTTPSGPFGLPTAAEAQSWFDGLRAK